MADLMFFDTQALTRLVERCFDLSMSGAVPAEARAQFLTEGKRLRELLMRALGARFDAGSADFQKASTALQQTNKALDEAANDMAKVVQVVGTIGQVVGYLDQALSLAAKAAT